MRIGILTFNSAHNHGAVLQVWSLQRYLSKLGYDTEVINFRLPAVDQMYRLFIPENPTGSSGINNSTDKLDRKQLRQVKKNDPDKYARFQKFEQFINVVLPTTVPFYSYRELCEASFQYDVVIAGSDQIWNGGLTKGINPAYFLAFGGAKMKRIAYAASIGKDEIPEIEKLLFRRYLDGFDFISVREQKAFDEVQALTKRPVEITCDPTILLKKQDFDELLIPSKFKEKYIYIHNVHLKKTDDRLNRMGEVISKRLQLPVVYNRTDYQFSNTCGSAVYAGPGEFLGLIANSEYVITNSFHATTFSIIYHKNFITVPHAKNPERMRYLLDRLSLSEHLITFAEDVPDDLQNLTIDYDYVDKQKESYAYSSIDFLNRSLSSPKTAVDYLPENLSFLETKDKFMCYGCGSCVLACSKHAISMERDGEGFSYPAADADLCAECDHENGSKVCVNQCLVKQERTSSAHLSDQFSPLVYRVTYEDPALPKETFYSDLLKPVYEAFLAAGGQVVGRVMNSDGESCYRCMKTADELNALYIGSVTEALIPVLLQKNRDELFPNNRKTLFTGTPCEVAAIKKHFGESDNLFFVEKLCRGLTSQKLFSKFQSILEKQAEAKMISFSMQNLLRGWSQPYLCAEFSSEEVILDRTYGTLLYSQLSRGNVQRPSCYNCRFTGKKVSCADLSVAEDLLRSPEDKKLRPFTGSAVIKINSSRGKELFTKAEHHYVVTESEYSEALTEQQRTHIALPPQRGTLMSQLESEQFEALFRGGKKLS